MAILGIITRLPFSNFTLSYVYRSTKKNSGYKKVATVKKTNATIKNLALGYTHYFKVKAYNAKKKVSAKYSNIKSVKTYKLVWSDEFCFQL